MDPLSAGQQAQTLEQKLALLKTMGSGDQNMVQVDMARGAIPGAVPQQLQGMSPDDLGMMDRLAWGRQMQQNYGRIPAALSGLVVGGGYEALKAAEQANLPLAGRALRALGSAGGAYDGQWQTDPTTSRASLKNVGALLYGAVKR